jgi:hypothetical protein
MSTIARRRRRAFQVAILAALFLATLLDMTDGYYGCACDDFTNVTALWLG